MIATPRPDTVSSVAGFLPTKIAGVRMNAFAATLLARVKNAILVPVVRCAMKDEVGKFVPKDQRVKFVTLILKGINLVKRCEGDALARRLAEERHARQCPVREFVVMLVTLTKNAAIFLVAGVKVFLVTMIARIFLTLSKCVEMKLTTVKNSMLVSALNTEMNQRLKN
jgi:hypothetical protein